MENRRRLKAARSQVPRPVIVCRCEEVTHEEVLAAIRSGYQTLEEIKRFLRLGMGHCGGRGCMKITARMIEEITGVPVAQLRFPKSRPPIKPIKLQILGDFSDEQKDS